MGLGVAIQHAPWSEQRRVWVAAIVEQLRSEAPQLPVRIVSDDAREGCWPTFERALEPWPGCSHHLLLQDDVELCADFVATLRGAIEARPQAVLNLYSNAMMMLASRQLDHAWLEQSGAAGPAMVFPSAWIPEFLAWEREHVLSELEYDTVRVSLWIRATKRPNFATAPSLVEHLGATDSLLGLDASDKVARWYRGRDGSVPHIDWTRGLADPVCDAWSLAPRWQRYLRQNR